MNTATILAVFAVLDASTIVRLLLRKTSERVEEGNSLLTCLRCYSSCVPRVRARGSNATAITILMSSVAAFVVMLGSDHALARIGAAQIAIVALAAVQPFLIYQLWRARNRNARCAACGHDDLLPSETPRAQELRLRTWVDRRSAQGIG